MRLLLIAAAAAFFAAGDVGAQTTAGQRPVDQGPTTPEANSAYQGGGVILQGAPGEPPPPPQGTPPAQTPQNAVPK